LWVAPNHQLQLEVWTTFVFEMGVQTILRLFFAWFWGTVWSKQTKLALLMPLKWMRFPSQRDNFLPLCRGTESRQSWNLRHLVKPSEIYWLNTCHPLKDWKLPSGNISKSWRRVWVMEWLYDLLKGLKQSSRCVGQLGGNIQTTAMHTAVRHHCHFPIFGGSIADMPLSLTVWSAVRLATLSHDWLEMRRGIDRRWWRLCSAWKNPHRAADTINLGSL